MSALENLLNEDHFERVGELYQLVSLISGGAGLGNTARQLEHGNDYPVERFVLGATPSLGGVLTGANMAQSIRNAVTYAQSRDGGRVIIPRGVWEVGHEEIVILGTGRGKNILIKGVGMDQTSLVYPEGFSGTAFYFKGSPGGTGGAAPDLYWNGGMSDISLSCESEDESNDGIGIHIESCINTQFRNVTIRNFTGGTSFKATAYPPDFTNQYIQFWNMTCAGGRINYELLSFVNCSGFGVFSTAARYRDYTCQDAKVVLYGGNMQSSPPVCMELVGNGGNQVCLHGFYYEGFAETIFKTGVPVATSNSLEIHGLHLGGAPEILFDVDLFNNVIGSYINLAGLAETILKARNGPSVHLINCGDPVTNPDKFDLDSASRAKLVCLNGGVVFAPAARAVGNVHAEQNVVAENAFDLPGFATGAEPAGALGELRRDTTLDRPIYRRASGHARVALATDDQDLNALLRPYAAEIWDPAAGRAAASVIAGNLDALTGILSGSVLSAPTSVRRPAYNYADDYFGGKPSFTCFLTGDKFLQGNLAVPVAIGSRAGVFAVYRCEPGTNDAANRRLIIQAESTDHSHAALLGQSDLNASNQAYGIVAGSGGTGWPMGATGTDAYGHAALVFTDSAGTHYDRDAEAAALGADPGVSTLAIGKVTLGGAWNTLAYVGCNVVLAYACVLKSTPDPDTRVKVLKAALSRYALR